MCGGKRDRQQEVGVGGEAMIIGHAEVEWGKETDTIRRGAGGAKTSVYGDVKG